LGRLTKPETTKKGENMGVNRIANRWAIRKAAVEAEKWAMLLATVRAVAAVEQAAHWNAVDYGDHMLYERLYYDTQEIIDDLAERILALNPFTGVSMVSAQLSMMLQQINRWQQMKPQMRDIDLVLIAEKDLQRLVRECLKDTALDPGMEAFLTGVLDRQNTSLYLIQQNEWATYGSLPDRGLGPTKKYFPLFDSAKTD